MTVKPEDALMAAESIAEAAHSTVASVLPPLPKTGPIAAAAAAAGTPLSRAEVGRVVIR